MALIPKIDFTDSKTNWSIEIEDIGTTGRNKKNPNKLNYNKTYRTCQYLNCSNTIIRSRLSGLCNEHENHQHDLFLTLFDEKGGKVKSPRHDVIINNLIDWAKSRNFDLLPFFSDCSFTILGNIPDVSTLSKEVVHNNFIPKTLDEYLKICIEIVNRHFPETNNSSFQMLEIKNIKYPARVLAITLVGLLLVEESNRGDRWFWREIVKDEAKTDFLGAAMPIAYFAAMNFPWGMEIGKAAPKFIPSGK
ncbi:hypothetical protein [Myroides odoratimimus]|uniref:hypothetical protein n=1 Tax=Myroides odoratimimus TaxID=76832 RepID=UPI001CE06817|nr:hypothetical protein [Myroides odoratimimus]MCA4808032.1 hypothetical protein [Myroides odoratimimus]